MLSEDDVTSFTTLYKKVFGKEISREEAYRQGAALLRLIQLIYKPMTVEEYELLQKRRRETNKIKK